MSDIWDIPEPSALPTESVDVTFQYANLVKLDAIVRNIHRKNRSDRALLIRKLKVRIPETHKSIRSARADIEKEEKEQARVVFQKIDVMNTAYQQQGPNSEEYRMAQILVHKAQKRENYYVKTLPDKIKEYQGYVLSYMSDIPSVDLSFEALMSEFGPQLEYTKHAKYTSRIIDLLQSIRNLRGVPDSSYRQTRASCQIEAQKLRDEIRCDRISLRNEGKDLEHEIIFENRQDSRIKPGQKAGVPVNGRDQFIKNFLEGALQKRSQKFEGVGMIRVKSLIIDREYLDRLIKYLEPGHRMFKFRIDPDINECYRGVARDWDSYKS
ncbi:hypothetical protein BHYA_0183g00030 [Botrytis hyacinthi]|uniref:Uncharacterized protein n=1 Tax=Botrytis hyacinthi TaxID=278943 RepID=A0A4Z1GJU5_9HELO|nr:hypothetical protein BHYA_0183g00030 [Botrytis hyacinthi]